MNLATWPVRVGAYIVDILPNLVLSLLGNLLFVDAVDGMSPLYYVVMLVSLGWTIYNRWILGGQGQSWGKKLLGLRLIGEQTGQPIGAGKAFLRDLAHIIDGIICFIGFLFPLWDAKKQTIADKVVGTVVTKI